MTLFGKILVGMSFLHFVSGVSAPAPADVPVFKITPDRKQYGMNSGIPFIRIADRVEVTVDLIADRVSGPPLVFKE